MRQFHFYLLKKTKLILIVKQSSLSLFDFITLVKHKEIEVALAEKKTLAFLIEMFLLYVLHHIFDKQKFKISMLFPGLLSQSSFV